MTSAAVVTTTFVPRKRIPVIGIVGGIGSGKSAVANWVAARAKVFVLNADELGHEALQSNKVKQALCARFGNSILDAGGDIERSALARRVFGMDADQLAARHALELIVHPEIGRRIAEGIEAAAVEEQDAVLLDAAILLEAGWRSKCDLVVFIDTPDAIRLARIQENRRWTAEELKRREQSQWSLMAKRRESDLIIQNDGEIERAGQQLFEALQQRGLITRGTTLA
jgi:dephospho-CoA kinase